MSDNEPRSHMSDVKPVASRAEAEIETQQGADMQTTLPATMPIHADLPTTAGIQHSGTKAAAQVDVQHESPAWNRGALPAQLGRFQYVRRLGEGTFGSVVQVWDPELQTHRAIKVPHRNLIDSGKVDPEAYVREARKVTKLGKHPGIVEVLDVQRMENGTPYVVSEFIAGGSLADRVNAGPIPWPEAAELVARIADAVGYAHTKGIVHRDLKPANILIDDAGKPVVVDFGLALGDDEFSYKSIVCGTYYYMSPQQIRGEADRLDGRSDVYSLGVLLYQLLAGRLPYKSRDVNSLKREILEDEPTPVRQYAPDVPSALEQVCRKAMAKSLGERYSTAGDFAAALRRALKASVDGAATKSAHIFRWMAAAGAVAALLAAAFIPLNPRPGSAPIPATAASMLTPNLAIHFQKANSSSFAREMSDADLPLQVGDKLQFHVDSLPEPMFAYVYWIDSSGTPNRVWPAEETLANQTPIDTLSSPPGAGGDAIDQPWWEIPAVDGPQIFFLGLGREALTADQLAEFESQSEFMRESLLGTLRRSGRMVAEFEYPERTKTYTLQDGELYRTRGNDLHLVISPKVYASDHSTLQKWFAAYHGWIVATAD